MRETRNWWHAGGRIFLGASLLLALFAAGCSSGILGAPPAATPEAAPSGSGSNSFTNFFGGFSAKAPQTVANAQPDLNCPPVDVRQGASTLVIGPTGGRAAMSVKYQGAFTREARECTVVNGIMAMRIGVEGRIVVGPAGGPGQVDVPLRIAVVQETPGGARPITTKFIRIPVTVGVNQGNVVFSHIEDGISFTVPAPASALDDYIVYVGFDPLSLQAPEQQKPKPEPKLRNRPSASVN